MSKLSPDARNLIEAARAGEGALARLRSAARARVRARVLARAGAGVAIASATALGSSSTAAKTALAAGVLFKCAAAVGVASVVALVAVGTGLVPRPFADGGSRPQTRGATLSSTPVTRAPAPPVTTAAPVQPAPEYVVEPVIVTANPRPVPRAPAPPATPAPASSLEVETALLARAQAELRAGHPDRALATLDDAELKGGVLREEQRAGRVLALCAAGRTSEARAEAARFLAESPQSPMAERVRSSCAGQQGSP